ncbi:MAG: MYXO-CTERM sorting domain-containing protein, partial [Myxococcales bacterium]|nr:MYXO-CTERM sorting domain-containing protein [Myxococcales bacterium]
TGGAAGGGTGGAAGSGTGGAAGAGAASSGGVGGSIDVDAGDDAGVASFTPKDSSSGCGCRVPERAPSSPAGLLVALLAAVGVMRRRRD